jgi:hypothetical protein
MRKEAVVAQFKELFRHLTGGNEENHKKIRTAGLQANIWTRDLTNTKQECYALDHDAR